MSDAFVDGLAADLIHFPFQHGFLTNVPSIFHPHDLQHVHLPEFFSDADRERRELWYGALCRQASMVAVASRWTARDVQEHFDLPGDVVRVVALAPLTAAHTEPNQEQMAEARERLGVPEAFILYPAQTWPHKNHARLLDALALLRRNEGLRVPLVATGRQTDYFADLERHAGELGVADQIHWLGFVDPKDLLALYASARAVVIPTLFEAASGPLWEAFRAGVPAACSNVTSLPEQAGDAAIVFDPHETGEIAAAIRALWSDSALRERLVERGLIRVRAYSWDRTARIFRAHYRRIARRSLSLEDRELIEAPSPL